MAESHGKVTFDGSSEEQLEEMADACLTPMEAAGARSADLTAAEYINEIYGINPAGFDDDSALLDAMSAAEVDESDRPENSYGFDIEAHAPPKRAAEGDQEGADSSGSSGVDEQTEELADAVLDPIEARRADELGRSKAQHLKLTTGVDASEFNSEYRLLAALSTTEGS